MSGPVPPWVPVVVRTGASLLLIGLGSRMLLDGYSPAALALGITILGAELTGWGLTPAQAKDATQFIEQMEGGNAGPAK